MCTVCTCQLRGLFVSADCLALKLQEGILPGLDNANRKLHQMTNVGQSLGQNTLQVRAMSCHAA